MDASKLSVPAAAHNMIGRKPGNLPTWRSRSDIECDAMV